MRLVYYSLAALNGEYENQWRQSIRSLRRHNRDLLVCLLVYNGISAALVEECVANDVMIVSLGDYAGSLSTACEHASALALYPTLHKFISIAEIDTSSCSQILYVDCDTYFFSDPELLFDTYTDCDWYAREAPSSRRCPHGYSPGNINEELLDNIFLGEGLARVQPFNAGVCLFNHGAWNLVSEARGLYFDNMWRLLVGRHEGEADGTDEHIRSAVVARATAADHDRSLPYPSNNFWIADEISLWLTLGSVPGLTQGFLGCRQIAQGEEFDHPQMSNYPHVMAHYFSAFQGRFFASRLLGQRQDQI